MLGWANPTPGIWAWVEAGLFSLPALLHLHYEGRLLRPALPSVVAGKSQLSTTLRPRQQHRPRTSAWLLVFNTDPGWDRTVDTDMAPGSSMKQATQSRMCPVGSMALRHSQSSRPLASTWPLTVIQAMATVRDPSFSRTMVFKESLGSGHHHGLK